MAELPKEKPLVCPAFFVLGENRISATMATGHAEAPRHKIKYGI
jgi:hypothetical protein